VVSSRKEVWTMPGEDVLKGVGSASAGGVVSEEEVGEKVEMKDFAREDQTQVS